MTTALRGGRRAGAHRLRRPGRASITLLTATALLVPTLLGTGSSTTLSASSSLTFAATADARVSEARASTNYGTATTLRVAFASGDSERSYLKFSVNGITGSVTSAKLRLYVTDTSANGGSVYPVAGTWTETGITWSNAPPIAGTALSTASAPVSGTWVEWDLRTSITRDGTYSFALAGGSADAATYFSREAATKPHLLITQSTGTPPTAAFTASPTSGTAPLTVQFTDTSTGSPTSWAWDFDNNGTVDSTAQNPSFTYAAAGTYTVSLTVRHASGSDSDTRPGLIVVDPAPTPTPTPIPTPTPTAPPTPPPSVLTFVPTADAQVSQTFPTTNYGTSATLRVRAAPDTFRSYLRFTLTDVRGWVQSAKLRLYVVDPSPDGGTVYSVGNNWSETGTGAITWSNAPPVDGIPLASARAGTIGGWAEFDVAATVSGDGTYSFALTGTLTDSVFYSSREGANPPQLVVTISDPPPLAADFSASPTSGPAPLAVRFTDTSTGSPTSWSWDFDDDGTIDSTSQNPTFTYDSPGTYSV
ncbi:MAG: DNRLRE domain-containing protein, partial [Chloroflexota bacterium]|nr:DNRLRE domain-containing protein [Chloroflexota bacterium]